MSIETITQQQLRGDAVLARKIQAEFDARRNTRTPVDTDNLWAKCRRCQHYRGDDCAELELCDEFQAGGDGDPVAPNFVELLTRKEFRCRLWRADEGSRQKAVGRKDLPATATSEEMVDRIHGQGVKRSQAERRAARRRKW